ncbi:MAG: peptidase M20 [Chitinophagaceae bacterium BSSC1]|nr:MAG: peptidase M20 [Chitinophagaceae bacterium BSSC1]
MAQFNSSKAIRKISYFFLISILYLQPICLSAQQNSSSKQYHDEIRLLANQPSIKSAFQTIVDLESETMKNLITLTQIPAPPFKEKERAAKFKQLLQAIGADSIWIDGGGNVIALRKGKSGKKTVVIEGHLDTVFPEGTDVTVKQRGDTLFAPGIGDDTRALTVVLTLLKSMNQAKIKTEADILFVGTTGEEGPGDLRGVKELFKSGLKIDSYISIDGGALGNIVNRAIGSIRYRITYKGEGGHSYGKFGLANPHNATASAIHNFVVEANKFTKTVTKTTYNIGMIGGGTSVNSIPFESWMEVDMRSENPINIQILDSLLQRAIQLGLREENAIKRIGKDLTVDIQQLGNRPTGTQDSSVALIQRATAAVDFMGSKPQFISLSTNANIPISKGIPAITIWTGGKGSGAHSLDEWWMNDKGYLGIQASLLLLVSEAGLAK